MTGRRGVKIKGTMQLIAHDGMPWFRLDDRPFKCTVPLIRAGRSANAATSSAKPLSRRGDREKWGPCPVLEIVPGFPAEG